MIHKKAYGTGKHSGVIEALIKQCNDNEGLFDKFIRVQYTEMSNRLEKSLEEIKEINNLIGELQIDNQKINKVLKRGKNEKVKKEDKSGEKDK